MKPLATIHTEMMVDDARIKCANVNLDTIKAMQAGAEGREHIQIVLWDLRDGQADFD